jgi:hypothetical protein
MVFLEFSYDFPIFLWFSHGFYIIETSSYRLGLAQPGRLEKLDTIFRAKTGECLAVNGWGKPLNWN